MGGINDLREIHTDLESAKMAGEGLKYDLAEICVFDGIAFTLVLEFRLRGAWDAKKGEWETPKERWGSDCASDFHKSVTVTHKENDG